MADFQKAFMNSMHNEDATLGGKVTNEPPIFGIDDDPKSPSFGRQVVVEKPKARFGINSHAHPDAVVDGFYTMDTATALLYAEKVYLHDYWTPILGDDITDQDVANKYMDLAINEGVRQATILIQRSSSGKAAVDGVPGPKTIAAINSIPPDYLLKTIRAAGAQFYATLYQGNKNRYTIEEYRSWIARLDA